MRDQPIYLQWLNKQAKSGFSEGEETAAMRAAYYGRIDVVRYLRSEKADFNLLSQNGYNVFYYALLYHQRSCNSGAALISDLINDDCTNINLILKKEYGSAKSTLDMVILLETETPCHIQIPIDLGSA